MSNTVLTNNSVVISGNNQRAEYAALYNACGKPPTIKRENNEEGFIYQGFYICIRPQL